MDGYKQEDALKQILNTMDDTDNRLINVIEYMQKIISFLIFAVILLLWRVFLWDMADAALSTVSYFWVSLSEGYKILVLSLIGSIPTGIIVAVISHVIIKKIKIKSE